MYSTNNDNTRKFYLKLLKRFQVLIQTIKPSTREIFNKKICNDFNAVLATYLYINKAKELPKSIQLSVELGTSPPARDPSATKRYYIIIYAYGNFKKGYRQ